MNKRIIPNKAIAFADGKIRTGDLGVHDRIGLEEGYIAGYRAALRDLRKELVDIYDRDNVVDIVADFLKPRR